MSEQKECWVVRMPSGESSLGGVGDSAWEAWACVIMLAEKFGAGTKTRAGLEAAGWTCVNMVPAERAERAEAALADARRTALREAAKVAEDAKMQELCLDYPRNGSWVAREIADKINALATREVKR